MSVKIYQVIKDSRLCIAGNSISIIIRDATNNVFKLTLTVLSVYHHVSTSSFQLVVTIVKEFIYEYQFVSRFSFNSKIFNWVLATKECLFCVVLGFCIYLLLKMTEQL